MEYMGILFEFVTYIILESLIVQNIHMLTSCKIKNKTVTFITICVFSAINSFTDELGQIPKVLAVLILAYLLVNRLLLYIFVPAEAKCSSLPFKNLRSVKSFELITALNPLPRSFLSEAITVSIILLILSW